MKKVWLLIFVVGAVAAFLSSPDHQVAMAKGGPPPPCTITISNINSSFDALACTMTITWDTNETSSSLVRWDTEVCSSLPPYDNTATGDDGTSHSVTFDVTGVQDKLAYQVESAKSGCTTGTSDCLSATLGQDCIG